jgi:hypothetical protein
MESLQVAVALVLGVVVILFVPALVWATVIAGLVQIVKEKAWERRRSAEWPPPAYAGGMVREFFEGGVTMGSIEGIVALVIGIAVMFFAPALVWAMVIAGLVRIVREKVRESRPVQTEPGQEAQPLTGSN